MLGSAGKKLGQTAPVLGGGGESEAKGPQEPVGNLAAGIVNQAGDIVDDAGNTVGKIAEGEPGDLVGNVVTAAGDIVGKDGGIVGKALPLNSEGEKVDAKEGGGFSIMGAAKGVKGIVDVADGTIQTVNRGVPLVGDLTKGLGLGGGGEGGGLLGGLLGSKPEDRDPAEKEKVTEQAKKDLFDTTDKAAEAAPINLEDQEKAAGDARLELTEQSGDNLTEISPDEARLPDDVKGAGDDTTEKVGNATGDATQKAEDAVPGEEDAVGDTSEPAKSTAGDTLGEVKDTADETAGQAKDKADETASQAQDTAEETSGLSKDTTGDVTEKAKDTVEDTTEQAKEAAPEDVTSKAGDATAEVPDEAKDVTGDTADQTKETAEGVPEKAEGAAEGIPEKAEDAADATKSQLDEIETVRIEGDKLPDPFAKFDGAEIDDEGKVMFEGGSIGKVVEGDPEQLAGQEISPEGVVLNERGSEIGRVELKSEIAEELQEEAQKAADLSMLKGAKVNKGGNLVNDKNEAIGRITEGILKHMVGRKADDQGRIWNDAGEVIGQAELIPQKERREYEEPAPFEDFPDATVQSNGEVTSNGEIVGRLVDGDAKKLKGKKVDEDGDVLDKQGNKLGHAERWEPEPEPEPEPEAEVDKSILAGKRVNKAGNVVDSNGNIFGRVVDGDVKRLAGRMCNKLGQIVSESGDVLGQAELVAEGDREGFKEGPFTDLPGCTVAKDGTVVTPSGDVVGRLVSGDSKVLFGRAVDDDGDILDRNGNSIGKAERWEPPEEEKKQGPLKGLRVNKKGEVYDKEGNLLAKLTSGDLSICAGKEIDDDNDVVDSKGSTIGHVTLIDDIVEEPEPEESAEAKEKREQAEKDEKLAKDLGSLIEQGLEKIRPICKMITDKIEKAERTPKEELDEEELVKGVKPLIEEGGKILSELNGTVRALDPDGRIQRNAKHKTGTREATPAEHHLAEVLKELTGTITTCIDGAKRKIEDMPHAKKELNPLWGLLTEPLFQILAAVGLLLTGVLNLVGRLLNGLGLGGIIDGLLGTLGLNRLLDGLGLGSLTKALGGKQQDGKKK